MFLGKGMKNYQVGQALKGLGKKIYEKKESSEHSKSGNDREGQMDNVRISEK